MEPEIKFPTSLGSSKKQESSEKHLLLLFYYAKAFDCVEHNKLWKILKEMGIPDHLTCLLRNLYASQEATVRIGHRTTDGSKSGKEYIKTVCCHPAYSTSMQNASCKMPDWMNVKLESRFLGEMSTTSDMQMIPT